MKIVYRSFGSTRSEKISFAQLQIKRVYDAPNDRDGARVLVDRLWPRGLRKAGACIGEWMKDAAPSADLRQRLHGGLIDWASFTRAYRAELMQGPAKTAVEKLRTLAARGSLTLLTAARDAPNSHASILLDLLRR